MEIINRKDIIINHLITKGGELVADFEYKNPYTRFKVRCNKNHEFETSYANLILKKGYCSFCAGTKHDIIERKNILVSTLKSFGAVLVNEENYQYKNAHSKFEVMCKNGHKYKTCYSYIVNSKHECGYCSGQLPIIEEKISKIKLKLEEKNAVLLSDLTYKNAATKYRIRCKNNHIFSISYNMLVNSDHWCKQCWIDEFAIERYKENYQELLDYVLIKKNGVVIGDTQYKGRQTRYTIQCDNKEHPPFNKDYIDIINGSWCELCNKNTTFKVEEIVRAVFEFVYKKKFFKIRPSWLINPHTGKKLEIDGFNSELKFGFEYQGPYHYHWHNSKFDYIKSNRKNTQKRDAIKRQLINNMGYRLVEIPFINSGSFSELVEHIKICCWDAGIDFPDIELKRELVLKKS